MIKRQMNEVARVIRHELQHLAQTVLENATNLDTAGMPAGGERGRLSPHSTTEDEHALRDVEFYTRLQDDIDEFLRLRGKFGPAGDDRVTRKAIGVWVGEEPAQDVGMWALRPSRFFTEIRKHDRRKYRKAVGEFWAAVSEGGTPSYRFASKTAAPFVDEGMVGENWGSSASGLLVKDGDRVLLLKRSPHVQDPGLWGIPGGAIPVDYDTGKRKDAKRSALDEAREEMGGIPSGSVASKHVFRKPSGFTFTTFVWETDRDSLSKFRPRLNWEHTDWGLFDLDDMKLTGIHPGVVWVLKRMG